MAAALFNLRSDPVRARALSAGTAPAEHVHPEVVKAMQEVGIDLSAARPQKLTDDLAESVDMLVTMGCGEACPAARGVERQDWPLDDPRGRSVAEVRVIRDAIDQRVASLIATKEWGATMADFTIAPATHDDERAIRALLLAADLPIDGLAIDFPVGYAVARRGNVVVGCAGLEHYGRDGLLRSVAVTPSERGNGIGVALVQDRLRAAQTGGLDSVYLLTTTAPAFFRQLGFDPCERSGVPPAVGSSPEFASICPTSAACLRWRVVR
jgi:arsenate reductase